MSENILIGGLVIFVLILAAGVCVLESRLLALEKRVERLSADSRED